MRLDMKAAAKRIAGTVLGAIGARSASGAGLWVGAMTIAFASGAVMAQGRAVWRGFDGSPAGTPPSVVVDRAATNSGLTRLSVAIHGVYVETVPAQGGRPAFQIVSLPGGNGRNDVFGDGSVRPIGRPAVPELSFMVGLPTVAPDVAVQVTPGQYADLTDIRVHPAQPDYLELPDGNFRVPDFAFDVAFYGDSDAEYPPVNSFVAREPMEFGGLSLAKVGVLPVHCRPRSQSVRVMRTFTVDISHPGAPAARRPVQRRDALALESMIVNWTQIKDVVLFPELNAFNVRYLVMGPFNYVLNAQSFISRKMERGIDVRTIVLPLPVPDQAGVLNYIRDWYNEEPDATHYVLLLGDENAIPVPTFDLPDVFDDAPGLTITRFGDHYYSILGEVSTPHNVKVRVGRLSAGNEPDMLAQLNKIMAYETSPIPGLVWDRAIVAAHKQSNLVYVNCVNEIVDAGYSNAPSFRVALGNESTGTNAAVIGFLNDGAGVLLYRGHGSKFWWSSWDFNSADFSTPEIVSLANGPKTPAAFFIACNNGRFQFPGLCHAEEWMRRVAGGSVSAFGATDPTATGANSELAKGIFRAIYSDAAISSATYLGLAIDRAFFHASSTADMTKLGYNRMQYVTFGDPEMRIRIGPVEIFSMALPKRAFKAMPVIVATVNSPTGPVPFASVAAFQANAGLRDGAPQSQANRYTDSGGNASVPVTLSSPGELVVTVFHESDEFTPLRVVIPIACNPADLTNTDAELPAPYGPAAPDGAIDNGDFFVFFTAFFAGRTDPTRLVADIANTDGDTELQGGGPDGTVNNGDFFAFFDAFFTGCP